MESTQFQKCVLFRYAIKLSMAFSIVSEQKQWSNSNFKLQCISRNLRKSRNEKEIMLVTSRKKVKLRLTSGRPRRRKNLIQMPNSWPKQFSLPCKACNSGPLLVNLRFFLSCYEVHVKPRMNTKMNDPRIHALSGGNEKWWVTLKWKITDEEICSNTWL